MGAQFVRVWRAGVKVRPTIDQLRVIVGGLENEVRKLPPVDLPVRHYFSPGCYARELFIPAGTVLTGKIHKYQQLNILSQGEISVLTEDGVKRVKAPFTVVSPAGTKRIAYAHTDCTWTTILATDETDPDVIEDEFTAATDEEYLEFRKCLLPA